MTTVTGVAGDGPTMTGSQLTTLGILGACMTRDAFNRRFTPDYGSRYRLGPIGFRSALPSVMSAPVPLADDALGDINAGSAKIARRDFAKAFVDDIAAAPPDLLLVDFSADIDLGVLEVDAGRYITFNEPQLRRTPWLRDRRAAGPLATLSPHRPADRERYLDLWRDAFERLVAHLARVAPETTVVLVRARQERLLWIPGVPEPVSLYAHRRTLPGDPDRMDEAWAMLDEEALRRTGWRTIDMRGRTYPTSDTHPWDAGPLHFAPEYYADLIAAVDAIVAELRGGPRASDELLRPSSPALGRPWDGEPGAGRPKPRRPRPRGALAGRLWDAGRVARRVLRRARDAGRRRRP